jgi:hypothetical protein
VRQKQRDPGRRRHHHRHSKDPRANPRGQLLQGSGRGLRVHEVYEVVRGGRSTMPTGVGKLLQIELRPLLDVVLLADSIYAEVSAT